MEDLECGFLLRGSPLRAAEQILRPLAQAVLQPFDNDAVRGPQDGTSWGTGSGSALNQLAEETLYHLFRLALGSPSLTSSGPASAGSLKDDREMRGDR